MNRSRSLLKELVGEELGSVVFVADYLQLDFSEAVFTSYVWPVVSVDDRRLHFGDLGYRDALCAFIGNGVTAATESSETGLVIAFGLGAIAANPGLTELDGPEIAQLHVRGDSFRDEAWAVWRPGEAPFEVLGS